MVNVTLLGALHMILPVWQPANKIAGAEIHQTLFPPLLRLFFRTYSYYNDRNSRRAVQRCIRVIFSSGAAPEALADFVKLVHTETSKVKIAPADAFVLVEWCSILLQTISDTTHWEKWGLETIISNAQALDLCLGESSRTNVKNSALVVTRRGLRTVFANEKTRQKTIEDVVRRLSSKGPNPSTRNCVMLGVVAGVCARLPEAKEIFSTQRSEIYAFYNREIVGSRTPVAPHVADGLKDFFGEFTTKEDIEKDIIPPLEKALLRAPEIVLNGLIERFFHSLPESIDLSTILHAKLLKPILSNIKSTNASIRHGALSTFKIIVLKCHDADVITKIAEDILAPLKSGKLSSADQRASHADMLTSLPISQSTATLVTPALAVCSGKEANEAALSAQTLTFLHYLQWGLSNGLEVPKPAVDAFVKGISDKKVPVKKLWAIRLGELFWNVNDQEALSGFSGLAEGVMPALMEIWQETIGNPVAAAQSGLVTASYFFTAISRSKLGATSNSKVDAALKKAQVAHQALVMEPKPSFLLNHRIFGKLSSDDDFKWFIRALSSLSADISNLESNSANVVGWAQAIIFCICSSTVPPASRKDASQTLSEIYVQNPKPISEAVIAGLWRWRQCVEIGEKDCAASAAKTESQFLRLVVKSICLPPASTTQFGGSVDQSVRQDQMISLLVLSRPELLPRINWIDLCLRVGVDPGKLARESGDELMKQILHFTSFTENVSVLAC